jgi:DNA-binding protein YbaB
MDFMFEWQKQYLTSERSEENKQLIVKHGSEYVRVHISRLIHIDDVDINPVMSSEDNTVEPLLNGHPR